MRGASLVAYEARRRTRWRTKRYGSFGVFAPMRMTAIRGAARAVQCGRMSQFCLILVKPSHYDDDGYVIQWFRSAIPSNSLAALYGLAKDVAERRVLGDVELIIDAIDETNTRVHPEKLARRIEEAGSG